MRLHSLMGLSQIDRLNLEGYANLEHWVARLDERIENTLLQRLTAIIQLWCSEFERSDDDSDAISRTITARDVGTIRRGGRGDKKLERMLLKGESDKVRCDFSSRPCGQALHQAVFNNVRADEL